MISKEKDESVQFEGDGCEENLKAGVETYGSRPRRMAVRYMGESWRTVESNAVAFTPLFLFSFSAFVKGLRSHLLKPGNT